MKNRKDRSIRFAERMELMACLLAIVLCFSQVFLVTVYAKEAGEAVRKESAGNGEMESISDDTGNASFLEGSGETGADASDAGSAGTDNDASGKDSDGTGTDASGEGSAGTGNDASEKDSTGTGSNTSGAGSGEAGGSTSATDPDDVSGNSPDGENPDDVSGNNPDGTDGENPDDVSENNPDGENPDSENGTAPDGTNGDAVPEEQHPYIPQLSIDYRMKESAAGILVGNASSALVLSTAAFPAGPETEGAAGMSPAVCAYGEADGEMLYADLSSGTAEVPLPDNFYGSIVFTAEDAQGNTCEVSTRTLMIDASAPSVRIVETELSDGGKQVSAIFGDGGNTVTGIARVSCLVNGEAVPADYEMTGVAENCFGQAVVSEAAFALPIKESGVYTVQLEAEDHAGNVSAYAQEIEIPEKKGPIAVSAPSSVDLVINPWTDGEQISSDRFTIENKSGYDIIATLQSTNLEVNRENADVNAAQKDCSLYLSCDMWGEAVLTEGASGELFRVRIPAKKEDGETNGSLTLQVHGSLSDGSEPFWRDEDVKLWLRFDYRAAEKDD